MKSLFAITALAASAAAGAQAIPPGYYTFNCGPTYCEAAPLSGDGASITVANPDPQPITAPSTPALPQTYPGAGETPPPPPDPVFGPPADPPAVHTVGAPEISADSAVAAITLFLGCLLILRGGRNAKDQR